MTDLAPTWPASPVDAKQASATGRGWTVLVGDRDRGLGKPTPMTRDRAAFHLGWLREQGANVRLGLLWENRTPDGSRWWEWVPVDDGWGLP